jgi:hypothetical protein
MKKDAHFYLFCKSYLGDLKRVQQLWASVKKFNVDRIPFYLSVPAKDLPLFQDQMDDPDQLINWIRDEDVVESNPRASLDHYLNCDGRLSQQVVKSEFWRIFPDELCDAYLCLDSDCEFIRDFYLDDFYHPSGVSYTVMHENKELLQMSINKGIEKVSINFHKECAMMKEVFNRSGPDYDWGPTPVIWSSKVWRDLDQKYLEINNKTIWDAIIERPSELRWYGEALLQFKSIPLYPKEPIFRVYHYNWQFFTFKKQGESANKLKKHYLGILKQSNWDFESDYLPGVKKKRLSSRALKMAKRFLARFR